MCGYLWNLEVLHTLELEFQVVVSPLTWVLGLEFQSSERAASIVNY